MCSHQLLQEGSSHGPGREEKPGPTSQASVLFYLLISHWPSPKLRDRKVFCPYEAKHLPCLKPTGQGNTPSAVRGSERGYFCP